MQQFLRFILLGISLFSLCFGFVQYQARRGLEVELERSGALAADIRVRNAPGVGGPFGVEDVMRFGVFCEHCPVELSPRSGRDEEADDRQGSTSRSTPRGDGAGDLGGSAFDPFFDEIGLLSDQLAYLRGLQAEKRRVLLRRSRDGLDAKRLYEIESEIRELLGEASYSEYELFQDSQRERIELENFKFLLEMQQLSLSPGSEQELMDKMYEARSSWGEDLVATLLDPKNSDAIAQNLQNLRRFQEDVFGRIVDELGEEQRAIFLEGQAYYIEALEAGLRL